VLCYIRRLRAWPGGAFGVIVIFMELLFEYGEAIFVFFVVLCVLRYFFSTDLIPNCCVLRDYALARVWGGLNGLGALVIKEIRIFKHQI